MLLLLRRRRRFVLTGDGGGELNRHQWEAGGGSSFSITFSRRPSIWGETEVTAGIYIFGNIIGLLASRLCNVV